MRLAVDLDNVVVEWQQWWAKLYCDWFGTAIDWGELDSWNACLDLTHFNSMGEFYDWFEAANGWKTQPFVPGAQGFLYNLRAIQRKQSADPQATNPQPITWQFVTSRPTPAGKLAAKELASSLYGSVVTFAGDDSKHQVNADLWIDDSPAVLESLAQAGKKSIRFIRPWNDHGPNKAAAPSTYACYTWGEVMDLLVSLEGILQ